MLFLDTEFSYSKSERQLISIGLVGSSMEFYAELSNEIIKRRSGVARDKFLNAHVLSQLGLLNEPYAPPEVLANEIVRWFIEIEHNVLEVAYDFVGDYDLLEQLMALATVPLHARLEPIHIGYLLDDPCGVSAANRSWKASWESRRLSRHHALADALALQARFHAVHGDSS